MNSKAGYPPLTCVVSPHEKSRWITDIHLTVTAIGPHRWTVWIPVPSASSGTLSRLPLPWKTRAAATTTLGSPIRTLSKSRSGKRVCPFRFSFQLIWFNSRVLTYLTAAEEMVVIGHPVDTKLGQEILARHVLWKLDPSDEAGAGGDGKFLR